MGVSNCYTSYNPQGNVFGNCGYTSTDYIPCAQRYACTYISHTRRTCSIQVKETHVCRVIIMTKRCSTSIYVFVVEYTLSYTCSTYLATHKLTSKFTDHQLPPHPDYHHTLITTTPRLPPHPNYPTPRLPPHPNYPTPRLPPHRDYPTP